MNVRIIPLVFILANIYLYNYASDIIYTMMQTHIPDLVVMHDTIIKTDNSDFQLITTSGCVVKLTTSDPASARGYWIEAIIYPLQQNWLLAANYSDGAVILNQSSEFPAKYVIGETKPGDPLAGFLTCRLDDINSITTPSVIKDTIYVHDTVRVERSELFNSKYMKVRHIDFVDHKVANAILEKIFPTEYENWDVRYRIIPTDHDWHFYAKTIIHVEYGWDYFEPLKDILLYSDPKTQWVNSDDGYATTITTDYRHIYQENGIIQVNYQIDFELLDNLALQLIETPLLLDDVEYYDLSGIKINHNSCQLGKIYIIKRNGKYTKVRFVS